MVYPILILSAIPAGGKSTLAKELCAVFPKGVHIEADFLRNMVVKGFAPPRPPGAEATHQFQLACENACCIARNYQKHGFFVVVDDVLSTPNRYKEGLEDTPVFTVFLKPSLEACLQRNRERQNDTKDFDTSVLTDFIEAFYWETDQPGFEQVWDIVLDTTDLDISQTVEAICVVLKDRFGEL